MLGRHQTTRILGFGNGQLKALVPTFLGLIIIIYCKSQTTIIDIAVITLDNQIVQNNMWYNFFFQKQCFCESYKYVILKLSVVNSDIIGNSSGKPPIYTEKVISRSDAEKAASISCAIADLC